MLQGQLENVTQLVLNLSVKVSQLQNEVDINEILIYNSRNISKGLQSMLILHQLLHHFFFSHET